MRGARTVAKATWWQDDDLCPSSIVAEAPDWMAIAQYFPAHSVKQEDEMILIRGRSQVPARIAKQCREGWYNHFNLRHSRWSPEDRNVLDAVRRIGTCWVDYIKLLLRIPRPGEPESRRTTASLKQADRQ
jgi:hypothetical protein